MTFGLDTPTKRCAETRAHYAHVWTENSLYVNCPGGPDERLGRLEVAEAKVARVEAALADPANVWWHTGGTACAPRSVIRAALEGR